MLLQAKVLSCCRFLHPMIAAAADHFFCQGPRPMNVLQKGLFKFLTKAQEGASIHALHVRKLRANLDGIGFTEKTWVQPKLHRTPCKPTHRVPALAPLGYWHGAVLRGRSQPVDPVNGMGIHALPTFYPIELWPHTRTGLVAD
ncbi:hypothetical protein Cni_G05436 [Canna indica]|uniref:Uncharacterized protein n=1 Tax=Canna indica TaxID=4628 RepID=A0AAQ3Q5H6_9LILI|nr:hypothetical protein Cni_G05436 [Canna indica]